MPTPKSTDDMPLVGDHVSTLQYVESRIHSQLEMLLRFREDAVRSHADVMTFFDSRMRESDQRYAQRFEAQNIALKEAALASEKAINAAMTASDRAIQAALLSAKDAVVKAELAAETRFQSMNEFRGQLSDQAASFLPRAEAEARFVSLSEKLDALSSRIDRDEGSGQGLSKGWGMLLGAVGLMGTLAGIVMLLISRGPL